MRSLPEWIEFRPGPSKPKTLTWDVVSKSAGDILGRIAWFGRWRRYSFYPEPGTVFDEVCLRDIATFCEEQTAAHRQAVEIRRQLRLTEDRRRLGVVQEFFAPDRLIK